MITQLTKARVDVHRRENMGSAEKVCTNVSVLIIIIIIMIIMIIIIIIMIIIIFCCS